jgi:hypothetical protein
MSAIRFRGAFSRSDKQTEELKVHSQLSVIGSMAVDFEILGKVVIGSSVL